MIRKRASLLRFTYIVCPVVIYFLLEVNTIFYTGFMKMLTCD
jgi:hypothetical protein